MSDVQLLVSLDTAPASDNWGFVGRVLIGEFESYRTIRAYATPSEALDAAKSLLAGVLGTLMAGQEWRAAQDQFGHAPLRTELDFGLAAKARRAEPEDSTSQEV